MSKKVLEIIMNYEPREYKQSEALNKLDSSYKKNNFANLFSDFGRSGYYDFLEIGVLEGYGIASFVMDNEESLVSRNIIGVDLFDTYDFKSYSKFHVQNILDELGIANKIELIQENGFDYLKRQSNIISPDTLLHFDISNHGEIIDEFSLYLAKFNQIIFEGGSVERDNVKWMKKYEKKSLRDALFNFANRYGYNIYQINDFPSLNWQIISSLK